MGNLVLVWRMDRRNHWRRHGGHWLLMGDDPHTWRLGFSKIFLEIAPFVFAEQLLRMGSGATRKMVT